MIVSIHQPAHLPWLGYLEKIARSDLFVYLDDVQFEKNSFINRNRIKTPQGIAWLTIPVKAKGHFSSTLIDLRIDNARPWRKDQLRAIEMNYRRAKGFDVAFPVIESWIKNTADLLAEFCYAQLQGWVEQVGLRTKIVRASALSIGAEKSDLVLEICRHLGAKTYLSGQLGRQYLDEAAFSKAGIGIEYQSFVPPEYPQLWGDFVPNLSALDYWMNMGSLDAILAP